MMEAGGGNGGDPSKFDDIYLYTGKEREQEIGLAYFGARWYNADMGRFISCDPIAMKIEEPVNINKYQYCGNNPLIYIDANGLFPIRKQGFLGDFMIGHYFACNAEVMYVELFNDPRTTINKGLNIVNTAVNLSMFSIGRCLPDGYTNWLDYYRNYSYSKAYEYFKKGLR